MVNLLLKKLREKQARRTTPQYEVTRSGEEIMSRVKYVLTSGIQPLDDAVGGFPFGRIIEIFGLEGSGKTALVWLLTVRAYQRCIFEKVKDKAGSVTWKQVEDCDVFVVYIDNEQSLDDNETLVVNGIHVTDAIIGRCDTVESTFQLVQDNVEIIQQLTAESGRPTFIFAVTDTIASTSSEDEMNSKMDKQDYPRGAARLKAGFRRMTRFINRNNVLWICTNQVGEAFNVAFRKGGSNAPNPDKFVPPGGRALKFFSSIRVFMYNAYKYKLHRSSPNPSGFVSKFVTVKNRIIKPMRKGRFVLLYEGGINNIYSKLEMLVELGLAERSETGQYGFRFAAAGIEPTTFKAQSARGNPRLPSLPEWPAFWEAHAVDMEKLYAKGREIMFSDGPGATDSDAILSGIDEDDDKEEGTD